MSSQADSQLKGHQENKHPHNTFAECFPERAKLAQYICLLLMNSVGIDLWSAP